MDQRAQCAGEVMVGYSPLSYFILGCIEIAVCSFLAIVIIKRNFIPSVNQATRINFLLPVYLTVVIFLVALGILMGADRVIGLYPTNLYVTICRWFVLRACTEGLSIFFRQAGIGLGSVKQSILFGALWSLINTLILLACLLLFGFQVFTIMCILVAASLVAYYGVMWLAPYKTVHRRPAAASFACLNVLILLAQIGTIMSYMGGDQRTNSNCAVELMFSIVEFIQLGIMLYAFLLDSMFWQGLYTDETTNLNLPMLGMWDMNDRNTVKMVTESIAQLERKVVYIIPFSQLRVDTSKFFSGGSARVYRGKYQDMEVAIKFLFCMELTPGRVVEFCNEATLLNSLQHENIVHCHGVAIMPPAISLVTEFCTYGSLFDFLHSMDWMVTDERMSMLSASVQSWATDRLSGASGAAQGGTTQSTVSPQLSTSGPDGQTLPAVQAGPSNTPGLAPMIQSTDSSTWPVFTQLVTPPPSPAPSPAIHHANVKRNSLGGTVQNLFMRPPSDRQRDRGDLDLEKGGNELSGMRAAGSTSPSSKLSSQSDSKNSSNTDVASKLADAVNSQFLPESHIDSRTEENTQKNTTKPRTWSRSSSFAANQSEDSGRPGRMISMASKPAGGARQSGQLQSATSILLTRELGYGLGPTNSNYSINYTMKSVSGAHGSISAMGHSQSIPSVLLSCINSSVHSLGHLLPTGIKLRMAKECCAGVMYLHSKSIMHCDIKSLNFLVTANLNVKLADLGEARFFSDNDPRKLPRNINWSCPEILLDMPTAQIHASADIWSLAMVISEICNGEVPYDSAECRAMSLDAFIAHLRAGNRPQLSKEFAHLPWLHDLLNCAWSFDASDRCTSSEMYLKFVENIG